MINKIIIKKFINFMVTRKLFSLLIAEKFITEINEHNKYFQSFSTIKT